jgi:hypothetical protein
VRDKGKTVEEEKPPLKAKCVTISSFRSRGFINQLIKENIYPDIR